MDFPARFGGLVMEIKIYGSIMQCSVRLFTFATGYSKYLAKKPPCRSKSEIRRTCIVIRFNENNINFNMNSYYPDPL